MQKLKYIFLPVVASVFSVLAFFLLTYKVHLTRETDHLGYMILFLILTGQLLLFVHGIINESVYIYIPAMIIVCLLISVIYIKVSIEK